MDEHLSDDALIRHFYGDEGAAEEARVDEHLRDCGVCRGHWNEITATLKAVDLAAAPEPAEGFEDRIWARIEPALHDEAAFERRPRSWFGLGVAAGLAAAVVAGVLVTREAPREAPAAAVPASAQTLDSNGRERVLLTALDDHFQRSEMLLVELLNAPASDDAELMFQRATANDLLDSGRLYRVAAEQNGNFRLADMLEDLESVLVEVARSPEPVDLRALGPLRARIESDDLLFKVRVVSQQIEDRRRDLSTQ